MKLPIVTVLIAAFGTATAQDARMNRNVQPEPDAASRPITWNEGVQILQTAWQNIGNFDASLDCSHLVNQIYEVAGLHYTYASSNELYQGVDGFERVRRPQPADLIVWRGHVGVVVDPREHTFYSSLRTGPKLDSYDSPAWRVRGPARFFRFLVRAGEYVGSAPAQTLTAARNGQSGNDQDVSEEMPSPVSNEVRVARTTATASSDEIFLKADRHHKEAIEKELLQAWSDASDDRQERWEQAQNVLIVESLKIERIHLSGSTGTLQARIKSPARLTSEGLQVHSSIEPVRFRLVRNQNGWKIDSSANRIFLSGDAAVVAIADRLAAMARENSSRAEEAQAAALLHAMLR